MQDNLRRTRRAPMLWAAVLALVLGAGGHAGAQAQVRDGAAPTTDAGAAPAADAGASPRLKVVTREVPPFAMRDAAGDWQGIAIDLWRAVAEAQGFDYELVEMGLVEMLEAVQAGRVDAAAAALTITSDREARLDFSHPFHTSGLGIAVNQHPGGGMLATLKRIVSAQFLNVTAALLGLLAAVGVLVWLAERSRNAQFQRDPLRGIGSGLWWSAVTMTTVGYGDKAPVTLLGRAVGMVWMFASVIIISGFTAAIASALTVGHLDGAIKGPADLRGARVVTLAGSTSAEYLDGERIAFDTLSSVPEALARLAANDIDAVVYDAPILRYLIAADYPQRLRVLPSVLQRQDYGIALPQGSPYREQVNEALLTTIRSAAWPQRLEAYLGSAD